MTELKPGTEVLFTGTYDEDLNVSRLSGQVGRIVPPPAGMVPVQGFSHVQFADPAGTWRLPHSMLTPQPSEPAEVTPVTWDVKSEGVDVMQLRTAAKQIAGHLLDMFSQGEPVEKIDAEVRSLSLDNARRVYDELRITEEQRLDQAKRARATADAVASIVSDETRWAAIDVAEDGEEKVPEAQCTKTMPHSPHEWLTPLSRHKRTCPGVGVRLLYNDASI